MAWIGFLVWSAVGLFFIGLGFYLIYGTRKTAFGFWANVETFPVDDVNGYNRALGKLWCGYGLLFILLGLPLLAGQNSAWALLSILGTVFSTLGLMLIYVLCIEPKYKKKSR